MSRLVWMLVGICLLPPPAQGGVIRGSVRPPGAGAASSRGGHRSSAATTSRLDSSTSEVIYLEEIPAKLEKKLAKTSGPTRIAQRRGQFLPRVTAVVTGATVEFENRDNVYHNVFSVSPAKRFDVGKFAPGERRRVTFDRPGVVELFCDIDPDETGVVLVVPNHAFTRPDAGGAFRLPKLPAGRYRLSVWDPGSGKRTMDVVLPRHGDVNLSLRR